MPRFGFAGFCLLAGIVTFALQQGCAVTGNPTSWIWGIVWFGIATVLVVGAIWLWDKTAAHHWMRKTVITIVVLTTMSFASGRLIIEQYRREHLPPESSPMITAKNEVSMNLTGRVQYGDDIKDTVITFTNNSRFAIGRHQVICIVRSMAFVGGGGISSGAFAVERTGERLAPGGDAQTDSCIPERMAIISSVRCADIVAQIRYSLEQWPKEEEIKRLRFVTQKLGTKIIWVPQPLNFENHSCSVQ